MSEPSTDNALNVHIVFFDRDGDGVITRPEIKKALQELGFSRLISAVAAPVLALGLPSKVSELKDFRHDDTGSFDKDGQFSEEAFAAWWEATDTDGSGDLSRWELLLGSVKLADDPVSLIASVGEFQMVHLLLGEDGGLKRQAVEEFLNGEMFRRIIRAREQ